MGKSIQVYGFPSGISAEEVKIFLETHTGDKTVYALRVKIPRNGGARAYAMVQFVSTKEAELIITLASRILWYGHSYLKVKILDNDIIPKPRVYLHNIDNMMLYFGCQSLSGKFCVLWSKGSVSVKFGLGLKKIIFNLFHYSKEFKLVLSYENVWQIRLHHPRGQIAKYLVIQLWGAPRIYEKDLASTSTSDDIRNNYFMDTPDDQWIRTIDFSNACCIGQSSAICLQLPQVSHLPNFKENFAFYSEDKGQFVLESGQPYSCLSNLVPIVGPPQSVTLPYDILFKVCSLVQNNCLSGPTLDTAFYHLVDPCREKVAVIEHALEKLYHLKECCYEPVKWLTEQYQKYKTSRKSPKPTAIDLDAGLVYIRRVQISPCKVYFCGPEINVSNRVLRNYPDDIDNFLRVSFVDEELDKIYSTDLAPRSSGVRTQVYMRVVSTLRNGIVIGNKKFEFLAFSSSQLRDNSAWLFASRPGLNAANIRQWMGDFREIRNVAKYAARLGQSFSSSRETLSVSEHEVEMIPDIEIQHRGNRYVFSDGIGKISANFAKKVAEKCIPGSFTPSAFQIRYGGFKGVVAMDPTSIWKLSLRKSMSKFVSQNKKLDVLAWSKYQPCFLNRQLITLLSTLGVKDCVFEKKQAEAVAQLEDVLKDPGRAMEALEIMSPGENTNILKALLTCGYRPDSEPFLAMMMETFRASKLLDLRIKSRIFVPDGRSMMGCLDETGTLQYGEVFVQFSDYRQITQCNGRVFRLGSYRYGRNTFIVEGHVVVAKNPCLHPGDVRTLQAVDVPDLHHMVDCIVFPQKGIRPHPNECSGSDLDGDIYFVCWDGELIPPIQMQPMDYTPAPTELLDHDVTIAEIEDYFANYIVNERLGIIANAHTVFADKEPDKALCPSCIELARLFSIAVDFPKTGVAADIPPNLYVKEYPDFMEKPDKPTYESHRVIGKIFREVKDISLFSGTFRSFTKEMAARSYDPDMEVAGFEDYVADAFVHKNNYDFKLGNLMDYYGIKTEAELLSGNIMKMGKSFTHKRDSDAINAAVRSLRKEARTCFSEVEEDEEDPVDVHAKASAWYYVTYHPSYWGCYNEGMGRSHFLSFPWCVYDKLIYVKRKKGLLRRVNLLSLNRSFNRNLAVN